jgi:transmembrane sensor
MPSINHEIDNAAADWTVRMDLAGLSAEERAQLEAWLSTDVRHLGAYAKAQAILVRLRLTGLGTQGRCGGVSEPR